MQEPSLRSSRLTILGGLLAAAAVGALGFVAGRATFPVPDTAPVEPAVAPPTPAAKVEQPRTFMRSDVIALANRYADALSTGEVRDADAPSLIGRHVDLAIPFGCDGPAPVGSETSPRWTYDISTKTLRIHVAPQSWAMRDWGLNTASAGAVSQGFWVTFPWASHGSCPAATAAEGQDAAGAAEPTDETLAVTQFLPTDTDTPMKAFNVVKRIAPDQLNLTNGFRIRVKGRIAAWPDGQPIRCAQPHGVQRRPVCLVAIEFDEVSIENAGSAGTLATWSVRSLRSSE